jgi:hypothetical protein
MAPTPQQQSLLNQIKTRESGGDYLAQNPTSTASGAYQFINSTWQWVSQQTGVGTQCLTAASCSPAEQDANALWLLQHYGANSTASWAASAPPGGYQPMGDGSTPLVDLSGDAAGTPTPSILDQLTTQASTVGIDLTNPTTDLIMAAAAIAAVFLIGRR